MTRQPPSLAHEFRSPLNQILGYCEIAIEDAAAAGVDDLVADLRRIHDAGTRLLAVVESTLAPSIAAVVPLSADVIDREVRGPVDAIAGYSDLAGERAAECGLDSTVADLVKIRDAAHRLLGVVTTNLGTSPGTASSARTVEPTPEVSRSSLVGDILVVDDNAENREILTRRLGRLGHRVTTANDGQEALEKAMAGPCDVMLLDLRMPRMDGFAVLERMKADPRLHEVAVIVLSAADDDVSVTRSIALGAEDHLRKPVDPVFLRTRIDAALEKKRFADRERAYLQKIEEERARSDALLEVILPADIAAELKAEATVRPRRFEDVGVLFCDIVGFTAYSERTPPEVLLEQLQSLVEAQERAAERHGLEKIKTIGDAFLAVAGLGPPVDTAMACVRCGLDMLAAAAEIPPFWQLRIGVHCGPAVAGVVGRKKYQYDVWGDTVNTASRVEHAALPGTVCVTRSTWDRISSRCHGASLGKVEMKGKSPTEIVRIEGTQEKWGE